jgi:hypothetical protein
MVEVNGKLYAGQDNTSAAPLEILSLSMSTGAATAVANVSGAGASYIYGLAPILLSSNTFFPQVAVGSGWSTSFMLTNTGAATILGNLSLTDQQGNPWTVSSTSFGAGSSFPVSILSGGTQLLALNSLNPNDPTKNGYARIETIGGAPGGVATYQLLSEGVIQNASGVLSSQSMQFATIPVNDTQSEVRSTAYALANPTSQSLVVKAALVDLNGNLVDDTVTITLQPGEQIARYLWQDFNRTTFQGSLVLRAQGGGIFAAVALVQNQQLFTAIPVIPNKASKIPN